MLNRMLRRNLRSLTSDGRTFVRALIAFSVIGVTWWLTFNGADISTEWEAVFLVVVGYYFKDRPAEDRAWVAHRGYSEKSQEVTEANLESRGELIWQFLLAIILVLGTFAAFQNSSNGNEISSAWVGGTVLAAAFYFKETREPALQAAHDKFRAILAVLVTGLTIFLVRLPLKEIAKSESVESFASIPLQWVAIVLLVVTFYFKEQSSRKEPDH